MAVVIFVTGATGFLGTEVCRHLLRFHSVRLMVLVRAPSPAAAEIRLRRAWWEWPALMGEIGRRVHVVSGDLIQPGMNLTADDRGLLRTTVTHIVHTAALVRFDLTPAQLRPVNVTGTEAVLSLARACQLHHGLTALIHVSTAFVAGRRPGLVPEAPATDRFGFLSAYEQSKYEAECRILEATSELPTVVVRPSMIVGHSRTGYIKTFNTIYVPLRLYLTGRMSLVPVRSHLRVNLVPVDYVARSIIRLCFDPRAAGRIFHLTMPPASSPSVKQLLGRVRAWARQELGIRLLPIVCVPLPAKLLEKAATLIGSKAFRALPVASLAPLLPYFSHQPCFDRSRSDTFLEPYPHTWEQLLPILLRYATNRGFLHDSERTVFEQIVYRLGSRSRPLAYHDVQQKTTVTHSATEVRRDIHRAATALQHLGIHAGDRVALAGSNSSRYLTLDAALGLIGAVSVPLYATSPPGEIRRVLNESAAKALFLGTSSPLHQRDLLPPDLPVISFTAGTPVFSKSPVLSWEAFLSRGTPPSPAGISTTEFCDIATIRFTSGTTSAAKGAAFTHGNLRWMAQTVASLLPWRVRTRPVRYLSFLPLNHVVEGILAMYTVYYLPAAVQVYYLEDFHQLIRALPRVRPHIFFSVPRFYEKVWQEWSKSVPGRWYQARPEHWTRRLSAPLWGRMLRRRVGLHHCAQMIVGSAPCSSSLLRGFQALGIQVHNAYGLTEAPLITMNRAGANRIDTVGPPLPSTHVNMAEDNEVLARGPQVAAGYVTGGTLHPFQTQWLHTGDIGRIDPDGHLILCGRKGDQLITAYGKNIDPAAMECRLREIPGIIDATVLGEGRPYLVALIWLQESHPDARLFDFWDGAIERINRDFSHPEQIKRWAFVDQPLSVAAGHLTPTLKLRREVVRRQWGTIVESLYHGIQSPGMLHVGKART